MYRFSFVLLCIWGQFSKYKPPGGLYLEGRFNEGFFALPVWGAYIWRALYKMGLFSEFYGILINKVYWTSSFIRLFSKLKSKAIPPLSLATSS